MRVHRTTYQGALGVGLSTGEPQRSPAELTFERAVRGRLAGDNGG